MSVKNLGICMIKSLLKMYNVRLIMVKVSMKSFFGIVYQDNKDIFDFLQVYLVK